MSEIELEKFPKINENTQNLKKSMRKIERKNSIQLENLDASSIKKKVRKPLIELGIVEIDEQNIIRKSRDVSMNLSLKYTDDPISNFQKYLGDILKKRLIKKNYKLISENSIDKSVKNENEDHLSKKKKINDIVRRNNKIIDLIAKKKGKNNLKTFSNKIKYFEHLDTFIDCRSFF